ncbi:fructose-1,6-bisphosphate aldolase, class II [candidate division WOR-3 bacterium JGI_Cruoil_03_51_56]|uniref:Fructose-1,6-bisphosphate aldolase, class II n=1 Tax=candidate division WOR-3 bacterium JGI_Cruoil_03_51_56 TaxID=1973747 RepID=A0A235BVU3_UNCW3|nr:MAG: fructose-1,6-bisphosphate aldolase, class II [candidate division WOR-3 bacterium JGI_Cruoil_03_51_56]
MSLVPGKEILAEANRQGYAVGAFNFNNLEFLQAIVTAADHTETPVFIATTEGAIKYAGLDYIVAMAQTATRSTKTPICLHLDHGRNLDVIRRCIDAGYTSVMIDASNLAFEENTAKTKAVVEIAHKKGVSVEAELGRLKGIEDNISVAERDSFLVDPEQARRFVKATGVDSLAPAIGTSHGAFKFKGKPRLDFDRLHQVKALTNGLPLVLHGASTVPRELLDRCQKSGVKIPGAQGVPEEQLIQAIKHGINKVNVDTDLRLAFTAGVRTVLNENPGQFDPRKYLSPGRESVAELVKGKILLFRQGR